MQYPHLFGDVPPTAPRCRHRHHPGYPLYPPTQTKQPPGPTPLPWAPPVLLPPRPAAPLAGGGWEMGTTVATEGVEFVRV